MDVGTPVSPRLWRQLLTLVPGATDTWFLRACLHQKAGCLEAWNRWRSEAARVEANLPRALAAYRSFLPLLVHNLRKNGVGLPPDASSYLRAACLNEDLRWDRYKTICASALTILRGGGVPFIALKGAALSEHIYPSPPLRHSGDIDLLLHADDLSRARDLFLERQWRQAEALRYDTVYHLPRLVHSSGLTLELHRLLMIPYYTVPIDALWARSQHVDVTSIPGRILSPADNLLHACAHGIWQGPLQRWVADAWFILDRHPDLDWQAFRATVKEARLALPVYTALFYLRHHLAAPIPDAVVHELRQSAKRTGYRGRSVVRLRALRSYTGTAREIWSRPASRRRRLIMLWYRAFPPPVALALKYDMRIWQMPSFYLHRLYRLGPYVLRGPTAAQGSSLGSAGMLGEE